MKEMIMSDEDLRASARNLPHVGAWSPDCAIDRRVILGWIRQISPVSAGHPEISQNQWREIFETRTRVHMTLGHVRSCQDCQNSFGSETKIAIESMLWLLRDYVNQSLGLNLSIQDLFSDLLAAK